MAASDNQEISSLHRFNRQRVRVELTTGEYVSGQLQGWDSSGLLLAIGAGRTTWVQRPSIMSLEVAGTRWRWV